MSKARQVGAPILSDLGEPIPETLIERFTLLSVLAAASLRDPSEFKRLRLDDERAVHEFLETSESRVIDRQTAILDAVFVEVPEREIQVLHLPEQTRFGIEDLAFLVTMPLGAWHTALAAAERFDDSLRRQLEANVIVAPRVGDEVSVGGIQVARLGPQPYFPTSPGVAHAYATAAGLQVAEMGAGQPATAVLGKLVHLSWMSVLHRRRAQQWGEATPSVRDELEAVQRSIIEGQWHPRKESVLTILFDQVEQEMESADFPEVTLVGALADIQTVRMDDPDSDEARLLQMIGALWSDAPGGER
ncbi:hypothetical protein [Glycomyces sambucus]|uniref:hypothetical protein n=1 Tax=Glycomyces sambucus TaxID=380244 RepID=UPI00115FF138|nr:hypothetical protein [Glycomyces sambucus]